MRSLATPANMKAYELMHPGRDGVEPDGTKYHVEPVRAVALDTFTGETFSASAGDYWSTPDDVPLTGEGGEPLILVVERTYYEDALTGEKV
jgi:hypothetical protein